MRPFSKLSINAAVLSLAFLAAAPRAQAVELVMFEEVGCIYCARWHAEVGDAYAITTEGKFAPLRPVFKHQERPTDITFKGPLTFTPTFVLVDEGVELTRLEGYPGEDFFWGLLDQMLRQNTNYTGQEGDAPGPTAIIN